MLYAQILLLVLTDALLVIALVDSISERLLRPVLLSLAAIIGTTAYFALLIIFNGTAAAAILTYLTIAFAVVFTILSLVVYFPKSTEAMPDNIAQYDERDNMFSRNNLQYHPNLAEKFYTSHPDLKQGDRQIHAKTELGRARIALLRPVPYPHRQRGIHVPRPPAYAVQNPQG